MKHPPEFYERVSAKEFGECPTCGEPAKVVMSGEGTSHYESVAESRVQELEGERDEARADLRLQSYLENGWERTYEAWEEAQKARENLEARATAAEKERDAWKRVAELREELKEVGDLDEAYGDWGDRYAEVESELSRWEERARSGHEESIDDGRFTLDEVLSPESCKAREAAESRLARLEEEKNELQVKLDAGIMALQEFVDATQDRRQPSEAVLHRAVALAESALTHFTPPSEDRS